VPEGTLEGLLDAYRELRGIEAVYRWVSGRAVEVFDPTSEAFALSAELADLPEGVAELAARIKASRATIREAFQAVLARGSIAALAAAPEPSPQ